MQVERTEKAVIIRLSASVDTDDLQDMLNYARYKELTVGLSISQQEVDELAAGINRDLRKENKKEFIEAE